MSEAKLVPIPEPVPAPVAMVLPTPASLAEQPPSAAEIRRRRARRLALRYLVCVGLPTLLAFAYYGLIASPQYDSRAVIAIESNEGRDAAEVTKKKDSNAGNQRDARMLRDYIRSHEVLEKLAAEHGLVAHYQSGGDWWARLAGDAGRDDTYDYYRHKVEVKQETSSNVLDLRVRAFAPAVAKEAADAIVAEAKAWTARLSEQGGREQLAPAEHEVELAKERLAAARRAAPAAGTAPDYDPAVMELELADKALDSALENLQATRLEVARAARYLVVITAPTSPDAAAAPKRGWDIATVFVCALVLTSVISLLGAAVREHANF